MSDVVQFAIIGLGIGALYSLAAIGLVLVYRGSRVVNFAQGAMGMVAAYVYFELQQGLHAPVPIAIAGGLAASAAVGAAFYALVIRRLRDASNLIKVVATLALLLVLQQTAQIVYGETPRVVPPLLPTAPVSLFGTSVGEDRLWILGIVIVLTA